MGEARLSHRLMTCLWVKVSPGRPCVEGGGDGGRLGGQCGSLVGESEVYTPLLAIKAPAPAASTFLPAPTGFRPSQSQTLQIGGRSPTPTELGDLLPSHYMSGGGGQPQEEITWIRCHVTQHVINVNEPRDPEKESAAAAAAAAAAVVVIVVVVIVVVFDDNDDGDHDHDHDHDDDDEDHDDVVVVVVVAISGTLTRAASHVSSAARATSCISQAECKAAGLERYHSCGLLYFGRQPGFKKEGCQQIARLPYKPPPRPKNTTATYQRRLEDYRKHKEALDICMNTHPRRMTNRQKVMCVKYKTKEGNWVELKPVL